MPSQLQLDSVSFSDKANQRADADTDVEIRCTRAQFVQRAAKKKNHRRRADEAAHLVRHLRLSEEERKKNGKRKIFSTHTHTHMR